MSSTRSRPWQELRREMAVSPARAFGTLYRRYQEAANASYGERGWKRLTLSHVQFLAETDEAGTRLSDVATALKTTKQYVGKLARDMVVKRLVTLAVDPADRRAMLVRPTERGRAFFQDACEIRGELEDRFLGQLSPSRRKAFIAALEELIRR
ncbi:MAG TPA: MarR family winged helix-turn-helix transcriptional regulator [Gemmatimonadales bacterium]